MAKSKFLIKEDYFREINEKSAYILGFIIADGCIINRKPGHNSYFLTITIQARDIEILEFIRDEISPKRPIYTINKGKFIHKRLVIYSNVLCGDLIDLGVIPAKGGKEYLPRINKKYYPDLIRGLFDGDGCLFQRSNRPDSLFQITSASSNLINQLIEYFGFGFNRPSNPNYGNFIVYERDNLFKIRAILYYCDSIFYLRRKRDKFFTIKNITRIDAFGESKKMSEWIRDSRCLVSANCIKYRVNTLKMSYEEAMTIPPHFKKSPKRARISV